MNFPRYRDLVLVLRGPPYQIYLTPSSPKLTPMLKNSHPTTVQLATWLCSGMCKCIVQSYLWNIHQHGYLKCKHLQLKLPPADGNESVHEHP